MILFFSGVFAMLGLLLMLGAGYMLGRRNTPKAIARPPTVAELAAERIEQEEKKRVQKQLQKEFTMVMGYNEQKAYQRKQV